MQGNEAVHALDRRPDESESDYVARLQEYINALKKLAEMNPGGSGKPAAVTDPAGLASEDWNDFAARQFEPDWLGGERATFVVTRSDGRGYDLYLTNADGTKSRRLTDLRARHFSDPSWTK